MQIKEHLKIPMVQSYLQNINFPFSLKILKFSLEN